MKLIRIIPLIAVVLMLSACHYSSDQDLLNKAAKQEIGNANFSQRSIVAEANALALPITDVVTFPEIYKEKRKACVILINYLEKVNNKYILNITKEGAALLGVPESIYEECQNDILAVNQAIEYCNNNNIPIHNSNIITESKNYIENIISDNSGISITTNSSGGITTPMSGRIETRSQDEEYGYLSTDGRLIRSIYFTCTSHIALIAVAVCTVDAFGTKYSDAIETGCFKNSILQMPIAATGSGIVAKLGFSISDHNGGYAVWRGSTDYYKRPE